MFRGHGVQSLLEPEELSVEESKLGSQTSAVCAAILWGPCQGHQPTPFGPRHPKSRWIYWVIRPVWQDSLHYSLDQMQSPLLLWAHPKLAGVPVPQSVGQSCTPRCGVCNLQNPEAPLAPCLLFSGSWYHTGPHTFHCRGDIPSSISSHPLVSYWKPESKGAQEMLSTGVSPSGHRVEKGSVCEMQRESNQLHISNWTWQNRALSFISHH